MYETIRMNFTEKVKIILDKSRATTFYDEAGNIASVSQRLLGENNNVID